MKERRRLTGLNAPIECTTEYDYYERQVHGGTTQGLGFTIVWQDGPAGENAELLNGAFVEDLILAVIARLEAYQTSSFNSLYNAHAIAKLNGAHQDLMNRRLDRQERGVLGTNRH